MTKREAVEKLSGTIEEIAREAGAERVAVACYDYATRHAFDHNGDDWFHAASTIKLPILFGVFAAIDAGSFSLRSRVHVRNRFLGVADGRYFRVNPERDAAAEVHKQIGRSMRIAELARHMIVTSSNLATNLLVDLIGIETLRQTLEDHETNGIELKRGVEDEAAFEKGINNEVTANGLVRILRSIEERALSRSACETMLEILHDQEFRSGIPAGLPADARVAHKTGEISTVAHDAGLVFLPDRAPYAVAILTGWDSERSSGRRDTIASISRAVYRHLEPDADA